ncbi:MAG: hypothetical protein JSW68_08060 [Burkholderiales bacterium]|nr:MAG: hypothetical protein JSW68_08060 [Burkholderiales bacterium]
MRGRFVLEAADEIRPDQVQARHSATVEIEDGGRPALVADWLLRYAL